MSLVLRSANYLCTQSGVPNDLIVEANVNFPVGSTAGCMTGSFNDRTYGFDPYNRGLIPLPVAKPGIHGDSLIPPGTKDRQPCVSPGIL